MKRLGPTLVGAAIAVVLIAGLALVMTFGGPVTSLRVELIQNFADLGIPGISKTYEARVANHGFLPVRVSYCDFIDDANAHGEELGYEVQKWSPSNQKWVSVVQVSGVHFCKPYPLGIVSSRIRTKLLWPGQSVSTGDEATAAREMFEIGDKARFLVFVRDPSNTTGGLPTQEFTIDEHAKTDVPMRVRH